ncbi:MAG: C40 family peptidase, partial [Ginsengibacter sp.]
KYFPIIIIILSCKDSDTKLQPINLGNEVLISRSDTQSIVKNEPIAGITDTINILQEKQLNIPAVSRQELVRFAKTLMGTPYKYASTDPSIGFDCSGFITFVFNHFHWEVPRSSVDFTNFGKQINLKDAREGDLILFTGTNDSIRIVGHMGIVTENSDTLKFIHSTSGRAYGVTISNLEKRYKKRFVKVISIFPG